ncbi:MAG: S9 family peptidase [Chloroherpetonaceae bacterium]|nr:S9 family peptidase [Chloroherpetonaceae bacterium]MCS7211115.1 S9 family peptidase [Chloroherpetonaceae bacterium]MDW8019388.1 S9 family peptidase [Chloroherpetonaceae bacterium]
MLVLTSLIESPEAEAQKKSVPKPPIAKKIPKTDVLHGETRVDNYYWLREKSNPEVIQYLEAENAYTDAMTAGIKDFEETLYKEIRGRIKETDLSVPYRKNGYWYYVRYEEGKQYGIYCRKQGSMEEGREEILIDLNELGKDKPFIALGTYEVSDNGELLAYSLDFTGFRQYLLFIKNLKTGEIYPERIERVTGAEWAADNQTLFYTQEDPVTKRSHKLFRHMLGTPVEQDALLYEEKDELYRLFISRTRDGKFILRGSASSETYEFWYLDSEKPMGDFKVILPREEKHKYTVDHRDGRFYIRTNKEAKNFRLVTAPVEKPTEWTELLAHRPAVKLEEVDVFKNHLVVHEREGGLIRIRIINFATNTSHEISFPEPTYDAYPYANPEFETNLYRYGYQSLVTPPSVFEHNMDTREQKLLKETEVVGGYDKSQFQSERIFATASDGTKIPISLVYKKGFKKDGSAPALLYGYGSYGFSIDASFSIARLSLLERGMLFAIAHIRGGGEMGEEWHDNGKMMKKMNTFTDFIACAEHLFKEKYTSPNRLAIQGASAGGLLIGAVLNMRPDICKVAHLGVPFVDVINTMLDESLPLTVGEFLEWGNPKVKAEYDYIKQYCPYTNLAAKNYPAILVTTSLNDSQVMYWEPAKYVAKLRALKTDKNPLLLKTNMSAGHGGASGRFDRIKEIAFEYAFIMSQLGITK